MKQCRKERNKEAAAKSRANKKKLFDSMMETIQRLQAENANLVSQINDLLLRQSCTEEIVVSFENVNTYDTMDTNWLNLQEPEEHPCIENGHLEMISSETVHPLTSVQ